jgi:hypothetical protein
MNVISNITSATRAALLYITVGAVILIWSGIYYYYLTKHPSAEGTDMPFYWCTGFFLTGLVLLTIGLGIGWIGRAARPAEQAHAVINSQDHFGNPTQDVVQLPNAAPVVPLATQPTAVPQAIVPPQNVVVAGEPLRRA